MRTSSTPRRSRRRRRDELRIREGEGDPRALREAAKAEEAEKIAAMHAAAEAEKAKLEAKKREEKVRREAESEGQGGRRGSS